MTQSRQYLALGCLLAFLIAAPAGYLFLHSASDARPPEEPVGKTAAAPSWPMFGGTPERNMVNTVDKNIATTWNAEEGKRKNIKWVTELGTKSYGGPVIADGKIFVGTNNRNPRDPDIKGDKAVLMAFNQDDGKFLWQIVHEIPADDIFKDAITEGLCSTPVVEGKFVYYVTPACEVVCADTAGKVTWRYDMMKEFKVVPFHLGNCSPLIAGDLVMVVTGNGVNEEGHVANPKAPSFAAFNKKTGKLAWKSDLPGNKIVEGQWSNPTLATVNGKQQVIFAGGDCVIYALEPETGAVIWKCNVNPVVRKKDDREMAPYMIATPVVVGDRLYVGLGIYPQHPQSLRSSHVVCLDITKKGDVSPKSYDAKDPTNKDSALVWAFGGMIQPPPTKGRQAYFGKTISTTAVHDGLVYIAEESGYLHCLDAKSGQRYWDHDFKAAIWGSAFYVDGKVYLGTEDGDVVVFEQGKKLKILATNSMDDTVYSTPVVVSGVLYIVTKSKLFAIANGK